MAKFLLIYFGVTEEFEADNFSEAQDFAIRYVRKQRGDEAIDKPFEAQHINDYNFVLYKFKRKKSVKLQFYPLFWRIRQMVDEEEILKLNELHELERLKRKYE